MHFDIKFCTVYERRDYRAFLNSHLVHEGFKSEKEAIDYIKSPNFSIPSTPIPEGANTVFQLEEYDEDGELAFIQDIELSADRQEISFNYRM